MTKSVQILIAEDDLEDRIIILDSFTNIEKEVTVHFAENGLELLRYLEKVEDAELPSLIVLDLNMPKLNGTETLRALKSSSKYSSIPVIIFSTSVNEIEKAQCLELGAVRYCVKPISHHEALTIAQYFFEFASGSKELEITA